MSTLLERAEDVINKADLLKRASDEKRRFDHLRTRHNQIRTALQELDSAQRAVRLLKSNGVEVESLPSVSSALQRKPSVLRTQLERSWQELADDNMLQETFVKPVNNHAQKVHNAALAAWQYYVEQKLPVMRNDVINAMEAAGFCRECERLRKAHQEVNELRKTCPTSLDDFSRLDELTREISSIWSNLQGVPWDVVAFLQKATKRQATLDDLTPAIRDWLKDHNMLDKLRISFG